MKPSRRNLWTALAALGAVLAMLGLAYASVPLYALFCKVTGYGGTTQRVESPAKGGVSDRTMRVEFDASVARDLPWRFSAPQKVMVRLGEPTTVSYEAENLSNETLTGVAVFNVTPQKIGVYFAKMECFCFSNQTLKPGESASLPVTFYVDPGVASDASVNEVRTITLSYTFFRKKTDNGDTEPMEPGAAPKNVS